MDYTPDQAAALLLRSIQTLLKTWGPPVKDNGNTRSFAPPVSTPLPAPAGVRHSPKLQAALQAGKPAHAIMLPNGTLEHLHDSMVDGYSRLVRKPVYLVHPPAPPAP